MKKVVIQAGHINVKNNSIVALRSSTGAPGEQELNLRIANRLAAYLRERGIEVKQTDANANDDSSITSKDWDLFLAIHGDADYVGDAGGGFADYPEPITDKVTNKSQTICSLINQSYFPEVKINYTNHSNKNTRYYYMWKYLSANTPCVLIELGQVQDPHDKVLLANTELIANALGTAICIALGVNPIVTPIGDPPLSINPEVEALKKEIEELKMIVESAQNDKIDSLALAKAECLAEMNSLKLDIVNVLKNY